jgi:7-cyano-7-deazaguanine reductase
VPGASALSQIVRRKRPRALTIETLDNRFRERPYEVELEALEFTSLCPLTGAPDFGYLNIRYVPGELLLELKSLRDYLTSFRGRKILQEEVVNEVLEAIAAAVSPLFAEVEGVFNARGGIATRARAQIGENPLS